MKSAEGQVAGIAAGLAGRLRTLVRAIDRLDRLESGSGRWLEEFATEELPAASLELTLRLFRAAAEPPNFALLQALVAQPSLSLGQLMAATGQGRLGLSERLNDLVQVGLALRLIEADQAQITVAGREVVALVEEIAGTIAALYSAGN